ncbi:CAP domain-containing protein [Microvirga mediterraneensis]|uniref:Carboxypeptidase regulatory-like domain-containing protein n=1 Tax=Microvirga mediterraneensis TaxID=2754695 RepID=A0A838BSV1_9HYPH|nr:CAP domain-containing protein [Microvirga mediterraneensis]MBA1158390.1 carboxypeptidase regulatory-like domain-containing protein [Microvirga mediterraneensis]
MSQASAYEQLMLELVNRERAKTGAQPLAFNGSLNDSADSHSSWMIATDTFSHTGAGGSTPTERMTQAGYAFSGSWASAENIAWASTRAPEGLADEVELLHANLMDSPGHKANILNGTFREIGIGFDTGPYQSWDGAFVTENFARSGSASFLTGVSMADKDGDRFYDIGEGLGGLNVTAVSSTGAQYSTTTQSAGGYSLALAAGTYAVTFSGSGYAPVTQQVTIGSSNVKLDLIDPAAGISTVSNTIKGNAGRNTLKGTSGSDTIKGLGGNDKIYGNGGDDKLYGGSGNDALTGHGGNDRLYGNDGNDRLSGGSGNDTLTGGRGADTFRFSGKWGADTITDYSDGIDRIDLRGAHLSFKDLGITRFNADGDGKADDVLIEADGQSIALLNVKHALIGASDFLF